MHDKTYNKTCGGLLYWPLVVCSTDRSKAVVPVLVLHFVALWFILRGDLLYVFPCVILFLCFSVLLVLRLSRLGKRELILVLFVRLFSLCLFGFVGFLFLLGYGKGCGLWLWHSLDFSLTFFCVWPMKTQISNAHLCSLIRVFTDCMFLQQLPSYPKRDEWDHCHTGWMYRLIWVLTGQKSLILRPFLFSYFLTPNGMTLGSNELTYETESL